MSNTISERYIVNISSKDYVQYDGLLTDATENHDLFSMAVELLQIPNKENDMTAICKATAHTKDGNMYTDIGDASPMSVDKRLVPHIIRMASTRAKARALRDMCNVGMCSVEELDGSVRELDNGKQGSKPTTPPSKPSGDPPRHNTTKQNPLEGAIICQGCDQAIEKSGSHTPEKIAAYSTKLYGKPLCKACQKEEEKRIGAKK